MPRDQGSGFRVQGSGFRVQGSGFRVQGAGFSVEGSGFRVQGSASRVQGSGCRVQRPGEVGFGLRDEVDALEMPGIPPNWTFCTISFRWTDCFLPHPRPFVGVSQKSIFKRPCQVLAINAHKMALRTSKRLQERAWDATT